MRTTLENVIGNYSDADCFYQIFRMAEYIFHYQALLTLRNKRIDLEDYSASFGLWSKWGMDFLNLRERQAESKEVSMSYNRLVKIVRREGRTRLNCTYREVAELLNEMRNKYIGHGSMAFSVSADMNYDLLVLLDWLIELFVGQEVLLGEGYFLYQKESIKLQNGKGLLSYWQEADENWVLEYLDYEEGKVERLGNCLRINLEGSM